MANQSDAKRTVAVLLVDDHPTFREGLKALLRHFDYLRVVAEAVDERGALRQLRDTPIDVMIVDLNLKSSSGLTLIRRARNAYPMLRILVASMYEEAIYGERALGAGANGYICKQDDPDDLMHAIQEVSQGRGFAQGRLRDRNVPASRDAHTATDPVDLLSERELEIFTLIGDGYSTREIADRLSLSEKTISTHRDNIKRKIGVENNSRLIHRAVEWTLTQQK